MRVGLSYIRIKGFYYGYYVGYSGGGIYNENFFKVNLDLAKESLYLSYHYNDFPDFSHDSLGKCQDSIWEICREDEFLNPIIKSEILNTFQAFKDDDGEPILIYQSKGFNFNLLHFLSQNWCLLTSF